MLTAERLLPTPALHFLVGPLLSDHTLKEETSDVNRFSLLASQGEGNGWANRDR